MEQDTYRPLVVSLSIALILLAFIAFNDWTTVYLIAGISKIASVMDIICAVITSIVLVSVVVFGAIVTVGSCVDLRQTKTMPVKNGEDIRRREQWKLEARIIILTGIGYMVCPFLVLYLLNINDLANGFIIHF